MKKNIKNWLNTIDVNTNAIEVRDLSVSPINFLCLNQKDKIIDNVSFNVPKGKLTCFIGHNGAGKTTIVKSILGIRKTSGGTISINGKSFKDVLARENIGYIPEKGNIEKIKAITFLKNISQFYKMGKVDFKERVKHLAEIFNFPVKKLKLRLDKLSSGQNKIITIMQAFLSNPSIIIADEPTDNLDPETRDIFWDFIYDTRTKHPDLTFFIITHNLDEVEKYTDYIVVIQNGKMKCEQEWKRKANLREAYKEMRSKWN